MTQITTINPATDATVATYDLMSAATAFEKVEAGQAAFLDWRKNLMKRVRHTFATLPRHYVKRQMNLPR